MGLSAKLSNELAKAEEYVRLALEQQPQARRIRLELAEVLYRQGVFDAARTELIAVRESNPPEQVLNNINRFIDKVDEAIANPSIASRGVKKNWGAYISTGFTADSNVNAAPNDPNVTFFGLPFILSDDAMETDANAWFVRTGFSYNSQLSKRVVWRSGIDFSYNNYESIDAYDTKSLSASTGASLTLNNKSSIYIPFTLNTVQYENLADWYSTSWGIAPRYQYSIKKNVQLYINSSVSKKIYNNDSTRDISAWSLSPSISYQPTDRNNLSLSLNVAKENSGIDIYANTVQGVNVSYQHAYPKYRVRTGVSAGYSDIEYDGIQNAYTEARHDKAKSLSASVNYSFKSIKNTDVNFSVSYQDNDSNLAINRYVRTQSTVSVTKRF